MLLRRNAGLRKLVASEVVVNDGMIKAAYEQRYGPKVSARMILVATLGEAQRVMERLGRGEAFMDVAIDVSLDASRNQGGLLPDISPQDATFPKAIREAVRGLEPGQITPPVAMESGFAVLKVERKIVPQAPAMESVAAELKRQVTLTAQRAAMERQARVLIDEADVTVLDAALNEAYGRQRRDIVGPR
jgi:parvulin-like peptidyl-prolyl isomerase